MMKKHYYARMRIYKYLIISGWEMTFLSSCLKLKKLCQILKSNDMHVMIHHLLLKILKMLFTGLVNLAILRGFNVKNAVDEIFNILFVEL